MQRRHQFAIRAAILLFAGFGLCSNGCAKRTPPPVAVSGKVVREGKGIPGVRIVFWPRDPKLRRVETVSSGGGEFSLECPPGAYVVTVGPASSAGSAIPDSNMPAATQSAAPKTDDKSPSIPNRYQERQTSPLNLEVPSGGKSGVVLEIEK